MTHPRLVRATQFEDVMIHYDDIAEWMVQASQPFIGWLLSEEAYDFVRSSLVRESSEYSIQHTTLLIQGDHCVGEVSAMRGDKLSTVRLADMQALLAEARSSRGVSLSERLRISRDWFHPVSSEDFYISTLGIDPSRRRSGFGRMLMQEAISRAADEGHSTARLDVSANNVAALSLYRSLGFETISRIRIDALATEYIAMGLQILPVSDA